MQFITKLKHQEDKSEFSLSTRQGFKWWWAFTKKHNIISLYYYHLYKVEDKQPPRQLSSPDKAEELTACLTESEATIQNLNAKLMQCEKSHSKLESPLVLSIKSHLTTLTV